MNHFQELCEVASKNNWCWKLYCGTCGNFHFRYAFRELAAGKSPRSPRWIIRQNTDIVRKHLGKVPHNYSREEQENILQICQEADLLFIAFSCKFPDWLGYFGLVLDYTSQLSNYPIYAELSKRWAQQLSAMVHENSPIFDRLDLLSSGIGLLNLKDLESCEKDIMQRTEFREEL